MYLLHRKKIDIYANISLFLSYPEVTAVTRSDGGSAPRDDLYSPERQRRPGHLDEPQRQTPSEDPVTKTAIRKRPREPVEPLQSDFAAVGIELLCRLAREEMAPPTEPGFSQGFLLRSVTDGVLVPCRCRLWLA